MSFESMECHSLTCTLWTERRGRLDRIPLLMGENMMILMMISLTTLNTKLKMISNGINLPLLNLLINFMEAMEMDGILLSKLNKQYKEVISDQLMTSNHNQRTSLKLFKNRDKHRYKSNKKMIRLHLIQKKLRKHKNRYQKIRLILISRSHKRKNRMMILLISITNSQSKNP